MSELENAVVFGEEPENMPADDAQAMETEVTIEELTGNLLGNGDQTAENEGDGGPIDAGKQEEGQKKGDKTGRQIAAALKSQRAKIFAELGMGENEVRELVMAHRAEQMHKADPDISPKAARRIIEAQEKAPPNSRQAEIEAGIDSLKEDGWTREELAAFTLDSGAQNDVAAGKSVHQAATAWLRRSRTGEKQTRKSAVPTARSTAAGSVPAVDRIAQMSDKEFAEFDRRIQQAALAGKRIRVD